MNSGLTSEATWTISDSTRICANAERKLISWLHKSVSRVVTLAVTGLKSAVGISSSATPVKWRPMLAVDIVTRPRAGSISVTPLRPTASSTTK